MSELVGLDKRLCHSNAKSVKFASLTMFGTGSYTQTGYGIPRTRLLFIQLCFRMQARPLGKTTEATPAFSFAFFSSTTVVVVVVVVNSNIR
ncbi:hypothetical protein T07_4213 [Trichinella nelsoni]|uniref:Uncharacterized protein n=2 Tax=Trichinella TaxID=6333 RepID=A0A0V0SM32_9BILA|nr:hypothetical protein T07_4213 [Trichinella nelsoni]